MPKPLQSFDLTRLNNPNLRQTLLDISQTSTPKALVIDFFCKRRALRISPVEVQIPTFFFFTSGAYGLAVFLYLPTIHHRNTPRTFKDLPAGTHLDVPGAPPFLLSDMPQEMLNFEIFYRNFLSTAIQMAKSAGIIVNTFRLLEENAIKTIEEGLCVPGDRTPPIFCMGPLVTTSAAADKKHDCLIWLDSQPERSVVFLCFGSRGQFSEAQLKETAAGLERSGTRFMWVVRNPPAGGETGPNLAGGKASLESLLPVGFLDRTRDRGLVVRDWAPQAAVLSHDSVGGFVTHCGWNSILEAVRGGVPMVAWPLYAEQRLNRTALVAAMGVALPVNVSENGFVSADELAERVSELMDSEKGKAVRERVAAMRDGAMEAMRAGGSSIVDLAKFVDSLRLG
ncbi:anthocyanidin 5,3-O-glucosyltransferase-like [Malania oleifera]|uniref:anthocyanidin 5,3-O-glucosyltransferase-like n=1 Tax=Malania oleifera TaxID=397392 RepID=UPI0025AEBA8E|nr:anthocyanidin 5,3-O-glucosyltransferase-like [Malania oleifera]